MLLRVTRALLKLMRRNAWQGRVLRIVVGQPVLMVLRIVHNRKKKSERIDDRVEGSIQYWYCVTTNPTSFQSIAQRNWSPTANQSLLLFDFVDKCQVLDHPRQTSRKCWCCSALVSRLDRRWGDSCVMPRRYRISVDDARNCCLSLDEEETDSRWR